MTGFSNLLRRTLAATAMLAACAGAAKAEPLDVRLDYAYYNPVSLVLKDRHWVEDALGPDVHVTWILSAGSNKALEFLNAQSLDFGSTAGSAALLGRANGNPIKAIYVYSKPEWTALVTSATSPIQTVADLKGKRIAVTRGTDPHIFLLRALAGAGLTEHDVKIIPLQHADGRLALDRGDVDAWSGLDPFMAQAELETHDRLFFRNADLNTYGILNVREAFLAAHPDVVEKVLAAYERGRHWSLEHKAELAQTLATASKLSPEVAARQLERTDLSSPVLGDGPRQSIAAAAGVLKSSGVVDASVDLDQVLAQLFEPRFTQKFASTK
ncbi:MAG TPA: aliphatic sulfonate ABC transporter substrate-binding protein [Aliidongia sp.]|uniref:aliphatic sulfonate ABC transporter substrate-binding protein n=1 Tax=Aliidongia sp. TaxID=1914230 RepID=UPI002DDD4C14|nr:aliphatic sulfonate ABC transporter substrate-binding protein [Aliidongia sp.]HEV2675691.1 aliphatic sulfonate ABC transporter substrate-binding protein [Aliidongia sp.]